MKTNVSSSGITLIELLVSLAVVAILASIAIPSFQAVMNSGSLTSDRRSFERQIAFARESSDSYYQTVVMCPSIDGRSCEATTNWDNGWIVFVDLDSDQTPDLGTEQCDVGEDCIIGLGDAVRDGVSVRSDANKLAFAAGGALLNSTTASQFRICGKEAASSDDKDYSYTISLNDIGLSKLQQGTTICP